MAIINYNVVGTGSTTTVLSTELNSLATATDSGAGTAYDNTPSSSSLGFTNAIAEFNGTFGTNPTASTAAYLYILPSLDGTNYGDANSTAGQIAAVFPLRATTSAQRVERVIDLPPCKVKFLLRTDAGQTLASSGNTVIIRPFNYASN